MRDAPWDPYRGGGQARVPRLPRRGMAAGPVRVLALVDRYPPFVNAGAEWMLHAMLRHLVRAGHVVQVATALPPDVPAGSHVEGVQVYPAGAADDLAAVADVAVGHLLWTREVVALAVRHRLPLLYLLHNDSQLAHWRLTPANVSALVPNSLWLREATRTWGGPQVVVRPPVLAADYRLDRDPAGASWVTLVNPTREKGADLFYELARRRPDLRFVVVEGGYGHQVRPPRGVGNVERVGPTGRIRDDVYAHTRVLLAPSLYESWGRAAVEALCSGIPVVAHPTAGLLEALGSGGKFLDAWRRPADAADYWAGYLRLLDEPEFYAERSAAARARAVELDGQADRDLRRWERLVRRAALAGPRLSGMTTHDPFAGHSPIATPKPPPPPEPVHHQVLVDFDDRDRGGLSVLRDRTPDLPLVLRVPLDDGDVDAGAIRLWRDPQAIGAGDRVRFIHMAGEKPATPNGQWSEGSVVEIGGEPGAEWAAVEVDSDSQEDERLRAELRGIQTTPEDSGEESPQEVPPPSGTVSVPLDLPTIDAVLSDSGRSDEHAEAIRAEFQRQDDFVAAAGGTITAPEFSTFAAYRAAILDGQSHAEALSIAWPDSTDAQQPEGDASPSDDAEPAGEPQGAQEAPENEPDRIGDHVLYPDSSVPANAADVVKWVGDATSPEDAQARTAAAWRVEQARGEDQIRKTVRDAVAPLDHTPPAE